MKTNPAPPAAFILATIWWVWFPCRAATAREASAAPQKPPAISESADSAAAPSGVTIPGPLPQFLRMAGISQSASRDEILPFLARMVVVHGYRNWRDGNLIPTEYLSLLKSYLKQARELQTLAGAGDEIRVSSCSEAMPLLTMLGYGLEKPCGADSKLITVDPKRAFLTIDSGFPLADLENALHNGKPFSYPFRSTNVPILISARDWSSEGAVDTLLDEPSFAWLYWGLSRLDEETRTYLWQSLGVKKLLPLAPVLDFYDGYVSIRSGRVVVPGGAPAEAAWTNLVGVGPQSPAEFVTRLLTKDAGWLAAYFDTLARLPRSQQAYFTDQQRLARFYSALRGKSPLPSPAGTVFRPNPSLLLLISRMRRDSNGQPYVPGNLQVWKEIFHRSSRNGAIRYWARRLDHLSRPEQLFEAMIGLSRIPDPRNPVLIYLTLNEIDRRRSPRQRLSPQTVLLLAHKFPLFQDQYSPFSEWPDLDNDSISRFLGMAEAVGAITDQKVKTNAIGIFQATIGLWQILARQGEIPEAVRNDSWQRVIHPFDKIKSSGQLWDAAQASLSELFRSATGRSWLSQEELIELLAGPSQGTVSGEQVRKGLAGRMRVVLEDQRLVSLNTLSELANGLSRMAAGKDVAIEPLIRLAGELREFGMPKPMFTSQERSNWAMGLVESLHTSSEMRIDLSRILKSSPGSPRELAAARGLLTPFLQDILVGLNYAYYAPPGAQMLRNSPLFIRSHDFSSQATAIGGEIAWERPRVVGRGLAAGGGAHLEGSLADLPYVLAKAEQDFIVPEHVQALIWQDVVPELLTGAVVPRWWRVTRNELHAVAVYQRCGEELLAAAAENEALRSKVLDILSDHLYPQRLQRIEKSLVTRRVPGALSELMPAEAFYLAAEFRNQYPEEVSSWGTSGKELDELSRRFPDEASLERISKDFGAPHPFLAHTYLTELLALKPFPSFMGYSSQLMAESWESNNLYWARLADEKGYAPVMLNNLVPRLTYRMVEKLFASHLEDWPALLRALQETGEEFLHGDIDFGSAVEITS